MKRRDGIGRQQPLDNVRNLQTQNPRVSQTSPLNFPTGAADPSYETFDSKKVALGMFSGDSHKKRTVAAAQIHFARRNSPVDDSQIERFKIIRGNELRRACWIC
ncbi:MAG TPA: hypothetical protein VE086_02190 [Chthoniobacterales bacterium]|nr:hypothetical protein [Chthoniobacterales bacterium]